MNKYVIYTSLTGGYDDLPQYEVIDSDFDYICFTNDYPDGSKQGIWQIRAIPFQCDDKTRLSRYVKLMPHKVFPDYEYSIWLDANVSIISNEIYDIIRKRIAARDKWAGVKHPLRDCLYEDAKVCVEGGITEFSIAHRQLEQMRNEGFPIHYGLNENNLILRNHNDELIEKIDVEWWDIYCRYSRRDQFSLFYVFWKNSFSPTYILPPHISTRNFSGLRYISHKKASIPKRINRKLKYYKIALINKFYLQILRKKI
jgi:hypothetical protein